MRLLSSSALVGALLALSAPVAAQSTEGPWMIRVRALSLTPADKSDAIPSLGVAADAITVSSKVFPEIDIAYFFQKSLSAELVLTYPQQHDVKLNGTKIGTFKHLPPTLLAQYHFLPDGAFRPYLGAGVNVTMISNVNIAVPGVGALGLGSSSVGVAGQAGADIKLADNQFLNIDIKKVQLGTDVTAGGNKVSAVKIDPWLISVGYGFRF
jgi:outer membrane protein